MSLSGEWQTPPWLVEKCRAALGGYITLDAATTADNPVGAHFGVTAHLDALSPTPWLWWANMESFSGTHKTLFLNPPGERSGKLVRRFWARWHAESRLFHAAVWVDFNLDHLRFIERVPGDCLIVPRKRMAFVDPATGQERRGAQVGGFLLFRGFFGTTAESSIAKLFPEPEFLTMWGEP